MDCLGGEEGSNIKKGGGESLCEGYVRAIHNGCIYRGAEEIDNVEKRLPGIRGFNVDVDDIETADSGRTHRYCT